MTHTLIESPNGADRLAGSLRSAERIALDCEAAGFHRYSDRLCLVQISIGQDDFLVDTLAFDPTPVLKSALESEDVEIVMHGSDYDLRLLDRDLGIRPRRIFDTQVAAALLGEPALGLSALLERHLEVKLSKKYQRADWARRPLPDEMLSYAVSDTAHLVPLAALLRDRLQSTGRDAWATEEFRLLEDIRHEEPEGVDPVSRVKSAKDMSPRQLARLRVCLVWRDEVARDLDRALFRVVDDRTLVTIALEGPANVHALEKVRGFSPALARDRGAELLARLAEADQLPEAGLSGFPRPHRSGPGRPTPDIEARLDRIKGVRNRLAKELGLDRGTLLPNAGLLDIASDPPNGMDELRARGTVKQWQLDAVGEAILEALLA